MKNRVLAIMVAALWLFVAAGTARADIMVPSTLGASGANIIIANNVESGNASNNGWSGPGNWSFNPPALSIDGTTASTSATVTYTGSSLTASGAGAVAGTTPTVGANSGFSIGFTAAANTPFTLSGVLAGDIIFAGNDNSGIVDFLDQTSPSAYLLGPDYWPTVFDISGTLVAGDHYGFGIQVYPDPGQIAGATEGSWSFDLQAGNVSSSAPEPGTMALLGCGLLGLAGIGRRKFLN